MCRMWIQIKCGADFTFVRNMKDKTDITFLIVVIVTFVKGLLFVREVTCDMCTMSYNWLKTKLSICKPHHRHFICSYHRIRKKMARIVLTWWLADCQKWICARRPISTLSPFFITFHNLLTFICFIIIVKAISLQLLDAHQSEIGLSSKYSFYQELQPVSENNLTNYFKSPYYSGFPPFILFPPSPHPAPTRLRLPSEKSASVACHQQSHGHHHQAQKLQNDNMNLNKFLEIFLLTSFKVKRITIQHPNS